MKQRVFSKSDNFVYGLHTVTAILRFQKERCKKLLIGRKSGSEDLVHLANEAGVQHEFVDREWLERKFDVGSDAQGLVLLCAPFPYCELDDLLASQSRKILILDTWQDAANLGRAARAAVCFGAFGIVICKDRSAQVNAASEKSAVGALAQIKVARVVNLASAIKKIKEAGFFVYGADERGEVPIAKCDFAERTALVIGQEGEGLRELTKKNCDVLISIPMANPEICLNAADTALLLLYELSARQNK